MFVEKRDDYKPGKGKILKLKFNIYIQEYICKFI